MKNPPVIPKRTPTQPPLSRKGKRWVKLGCLVIAVGVHAVIKEHINQEREQRTTGIQAAAVKQGQPIIVKENVRDIPNQVEQILSGEKPTTETQTTIVNPPGVEPAVKIITPTETIIADKEGKATEVIPHNPQDTETKNISTLKDAQPVVDKALENAEKKALPKEDTRPAKKN